MRNRLKRIEDVLALIEEVFLVSLLAIMVTLAFAQVVLRHFGLGLLWGEPLLKNMVVWIGFLGAALAARAEKHFAWEAAQMGSPNSLKPWLRLTANASGAGIALLLCRAAWTYTLSERASHSVLLSIGNFEFPAWIGACAIPLGFALVCIHLSFKAIDAALEGAGR